MDRPPPDAHERERGRPAGDPIPTGQTPARADRRRFAAGALAGGLSALGLAGWVAGDARAGAPYRPVLERVALPLPPAHAGLAGLRIGFLADLHVGPYVDRADVERAAALLRPERPDLVLLGGDYVSASPRYAPVAAAAVAGLVRAAPLGGLAVLGNHDCGEVGRDAVVVAALEAEGIPVLRNAARAVRAPGGVLWVAGVDEALLARADPAATFAPIPPGAAVLALWHEPDDAEQTARLGAFAQLSGHSHGGQVRLPGVGPLLLPQGGRRYVAGLNRAAGMPVYTSRGVGLYLPPLRLNCPPEVTLVTLVAGPERP